MREKVLATLINLREELSLYEEIDRTHGNLEDTTYKDQLMFAVEILEGLVSE